MGRVAASLGVAIVYDLAGSYQATFVLTAIGVGLAAALPAVMP